jgi:hypothetical protein
MYTSGSVSVSPGTPSAARRMRAAGAAALAVVVTACAPRTRLGPLEPSHPASAEAPEAPVVEPAGMLRGAGGGGTTPQGAGEGGGEP